MRIAENLNPLQKRKIELAETKPIRTTFTTQAKRRLADVPVDEKGEYAVELSDHAKSLDDRIVGASHRCDPVADCHIAHIDFVLLIITPVGSNLFDQC